MGLPLHLATSSWGCAHPMSSGPSLANASAHRQLGNGRAGVDSLAWLCPVMLGRAAPCGEVCVLLCEVGTHGMAWRQ